MRNSSDKDYKKPTLSRMNREQFDCRLCDQQLGLGVVGECDRKQEECLCPEGFSGNDEYAIFESCHVNENVFRALHMVSPIISLLDKVQVAIYIVMLFLDSRN